MNAPTPPAPSRADSTFPARTAWWTKLSRWRFLALAALLALLWTERHLPASLYRLPAPLPIVDLQKSWNSQLAEEVLRNWGTEGRKAAQLSLLLDLPLIAGYTFALVSCISWAQQRLLKTRPHLARLYPLALRATVVAGGFDLCEDVLHSWLIAAYDSHKQVSDALAGMASGCAGVKFAALSCALIYLTLPLTSQTLDRARNEA